MNGDPMTVSERRYTTYVIREWLAGRISYSEAKACLVLAVGLSEDEAIDAMVWCDG